MSFDFHYGDESQQYAFFRIPKELFRNPRFKKMSTDSKLLYGLMLDRLQLSLKNNWIDKKNRIFIIYTANEIQEDLNYSDKTAKKYIDELIASGLITRIKRGQGKPAIIYVKKFVEDNKNSSESRVGKTPSQESEKLRVKSRKNSESRVGKTPSQESEKLRAYILENKTDMNKTDMSKKKEKYKKENKNSKKNSNADQISKKPTFQEVSDYIKSKKFSVDPVIFYEYYENLDWFDKFGNPILNWKNRVVTWESKQKARKQKAEDNQSLQNQRDQEMLDSMSYLFDDVEIEQLEQNPIVEGVLDV